MDLMDLKQIQCFVAAYEEGSFSKAAARENCTQPGVSIHIQRLEAMLSNQLFERKARGVTPTIAGRNLYASFNEVLNTINVARQRMLEMKGSVATKINVGVSSSLSKGALPWMLPEYLVAHPYVDMRLAEGYSGTLIDWVVAGEVDVAIVTDPPIHLGLEATHLLRDRLMLVSRPSRKSRRMKCPPRQHSSKDLASMNLVLPSPRHNLRQRVDAVIRLHATASSRILEMDGMLGTLDLVRNSNWSTVLLNVAVRDEVERGTLTAEPIIDPELWLDFYIIKRKATLLSAASIEFLSRLRNLLKSDCPLPKRPFGSD
jgi:LysR family transcriptional regulator, nitrogen assimilation regulatory protein